MFCWGVVKVCRGIGTKRDPHPGIQLHPEFLVKETGEETQLFRILMTLKYNPYGLSREARTKKVIPPGDLDMKKKIDVVAMGSVNLKVPCPFHAGCCQGPSQDSLPRPINLQIYRVQTPHPIS